MLTSESARLPPVVAPAGQAAHANGDVDVARCCSVTGSMSDEKCTCTPGFASVNRCNRGMSQNEAIVGNTDTCKCRSVTSRASATEARCRSTRIGSTSRK